MSKDISQEYKVVSLLHSTSITATNTGANEDVEVFEDDALVIVDVGSVVGTGVTVTVVGSLVATPTVYNQTLATFVIATGASIGAVRAKLTGIKNIRSVATKGDANAVTVGVSVLVKPVVKSNTLNSATLA